MDVTQDDRRDKALDTIPVAPPEPADTPKVRDAHDAEEHEDLAADPSDEEGKLDVGLDESFPSSDPPAATQPGNNEPAPSSGYDEEAEKAREKPTTDRTHRHRVATHVASFRLVHSFAADVAPQQLPCFDSCPNSWWLSLA